ncbi:MAG: hypothetical protein ACRBCI_00890 [Cellvibrionaceae bacterium]
MNILDVDLSTDTTVIKPIQNNSNINNLAIGQKLMIIYVGDPQPEDVREDLLDWWTRDYLAEVVEINSDHIVVRDLDATEDWVDCKYQIWNTDKTVTLEAIEN